SFLKLIEQIRSYAPDAGIRTNVIVGFPGETEEDVAELERFLRSEEHTSELQSRENLVCRLLLEKKNRNRGEPELSGRGLQPAQCFKYGTGLVDRPHPRCRAGPRA